MTKNRHKRPSAKKKRPISPTTIVLVIIGVFLLIGGVIILSQRQGSVTASNLHQFPAKGDQDAPVLIVEYSDFR